MCASRDDSKVTRESRDTVGGGGGGGGDDPGIVTVTRESRDALTMR